MQTQTTRRPVVLRELWPVGPSDHPDYQATRLVDEACDLFASTRVERAARELGHEDLYRTAEAAVLDLWHALEVPR